MSLSTLQGSSKFETTNDPKSISINIPMLCNMSINQFQMLASRTYNRILYAFLFCIIRLIVIHFWFINVYQAAWKMG